MTEEQREKEVVIKLTAATGDFISEVRDADKAINGMKNDVAGIEKLVKDMSSTFKQMRTIYLGISNNSISAALAKGMADAQKED